MAKQVLVLDTATGECGRSTLTPYPVVAAGSNVTVVPTVSAAGGTIYTVASSGGTGGTEKTYRDPAGVAIPDGDCLISCDDIDETLRIPVAGGDGDADNDGVSEAFKLGAVHLPSLYTGATATGWSNATLMTAGTIARPNTGFARVNSGTGKFITANGTQDQWVVPYSGVYQIDLEFGIQDTEDGVVPDQDSTYQYTLWRLSDNAVVDRVEIDTTDVFENTAPGGGGSAEKRGNKDNLFVLAAGDVLFRTIVCVAGAGGHTLSSAFCRIRFTGWGVSKLIP